MIHVGVVNNDLYLLVLVNVIPDVFAGLRDRHGSCNVYRWQSANLKDPPRGRAGATQSKDGPRGLGLSLPR